MVAKINVDLDEFKRLYARGLSDENIGKELGFSRSVSIRIRSELGLVSNYKRRKRNGFDLEEFKWLHAEGICNKEIADALCFSTNTAVKVSKDIGLTPQSKLLRLSRIDEAEFLAHYQRARAQKKSPMSFMSLMSSCING